ncbi:MAG: RNA polymerase factor sigma-54 [Bacteroidota bacterium]
MLQLSQTQNQQHKILPQQLRMLSLFHLNGMELEMQLKNELEENPFLEATEPVKEETKSEEPDDYKDWDEFVYDDQVNHSAEHQNFFSGEQLPARQFADSVNFKEELLEQLRFLKLDEKQQRIGTYLIGSLDDDGLLTTPFEDIIDNISFGMQLMVHEEEINAVLDRIRTLEPAGIAASDIRHCLLLQLQRMNVKSIDVKKAIQLLEHHYHDLSRRNFTRIKHALNIDEEEIEIIIQLIASLKLKPIAATQHETIQNQRLYPDFIIDINNGNLIVQLTGTRSESLCVNSSLMEDYKLTGCKNSEQKAAKQYLKSKIDAANWFVNAIKQRENTMLKVMKAIVNYQKEYFIEGDNTLIKPMVLRQIAEIAGVDIATVSRITCNKYADTHFGMVHLKQLFSEGLETADGEMVSNKVIRLAIADVVKQEDKQYPYSDQQLVAILGTKGFKVARRTVAKYRDQLSIPVAQLRMAVNY